MFTDELFEVWCLQHKLSEQAKTVIARIRSSPPSRLVRGAAGNVSGRYPSKKMGCTIQFESHRGELAFIYQMEHDSTVLAFYDQPEPIKLTYQGKTGKQVGLFHTPDFFVLREDGGGWVECKMEDQLPQLAEQMPHRYLRNGDGTWSCPPGEAYAKEFGLTYRLFSSAEIDWTYQRNLRFLEDYLRFSRAPVEAEVATTIRTLVMSKPALSLLEVLEGLQTGTPDDVYALIASEQLYVDLSQTPLADPVHVQVFVDQEQAAAYSTLSQSPFHLFPGSSSHSLVPGTMLWWDGKPWRTLNLGETAVTLLSPEKRVVDLPIEVFEDLLRQRKVTIATPAPDDPKQAEEHEQLLAASPSQLETATYRYKILGRALPEETVVSARTLQRWRCAFRTAEAIYGHGFLGLIPGQNRQGNHLPRLSQDADHLLEKYITEHYETLKQQSKTAVYLLFEREAKEQGLAVPSYRTFLDRIAKRDRREQTLKRQGPRAAAQHDPWVWELEQTTPKHGDRPWEIVHVDHTELDIELVSGRTGQALGRPWATFVTDAFSRRLLVVYLTFDPPSYRSCMMALRECVWRYGRFPQTLVVDGGPDFRSVYFEALLAYYSCTKASRPWARPRYGSVCERLFGTANTQFVHTLTGNTQITKQVRQVTKAVDPKQYAVWTLGDLYRYLMTWAYEVYDTTPHPALDTSPREAFRVGMARSGERKHCSIDYDETFRFFSLPTTSKGSAQVEPGRGVKINYVYYWSDEFRPATIEHAQLPVRYDPFDIGTAYAFVKSRWVKCISEYYLQFKGHSERELLLATTELRKRRQEQAKHLSITGKCLAEFLASAEAHEVVLTQRLQDAEVQDVFAQMGGLKSQQADEKRLIELAMTQDHSEHSHLAALKLDAVSPALTQFKWGDYYQRALLLLQRPQIEYEVSDRGHLPLFTRQVHRPEERPWKGVSNTAGLRLLFEQTLLHRKPYAILIDEAEHIAKAARGSKLLDQLDHLKSLAIMTRVVHVLVGTYDLMVFRNLSAQPSRRSIDVHFARYRATHEAEVRAFKSVLWSFQRNLPLEEEPDLLQRWRYCYERTIGCVGMLKDWLTRALAEAIERGETTISQSLLEQHALSVDRCGQMVTEAVAGEAALTEDDHAAYRLRVRLGLEAGPAEQQEQDRRPQSAPRRNPRVGQRKPTRDPVKKEEAS